MSRTWTMGSMLLWACASGPSPQAITAAEAGDAKAQEVQTADSPRESSDDSKAKAAPSDALNNAPSGSKPGASAAHEDCTPAAHAEPKTVTGEATASEVADTGRALIFDVAGISLELPACTPGADLRVIGVSWDTKGRPSAASIGPNFTRHAATLRVDQALTAAEDSPLLVRLHSKRELTKRGEKLVLAVESSGECDEKRKLAKLEDGDCSHWQLFDATYDAQRNEMVARIPSTGGYRLQFGWVPTK